MVGSRSWRTTAVAAIVLIAAGLVAYSNSFTVPFLLDDWPTIRDNPQLHHVDSIWSALKPGEDTGVGGRPISSLVFVLNAAVTGRSLAGFHAVNLAIHIAAALVLFGILRRTFEHPSNLGRGTVAPWAAALAAAGLWLVHPLLTESVTYISQRTEELMGLLYLATLYCFIRGVERSAWLWHSLAVLCCAAGMAAKEGMVTAPVAVFLYDALFVSSGWRDAWTRRWQVHGGQAATWLMLPFLMGGLHGRGVGFGFAMTPLSYALIEGEAILRYLRLMVWPSDLVFDHGVELTSVTAFRFAADVAVLAFVVWVATGVWRRRPVAYLGAWILLSLSTTSSFVPIPLQPISENRAYLACIAATVGFVILASRAGRTIAIWSSVVAGIALGGITFARNGVFRSEVTIWQDTVAKMPQSTRAHNNLGAALLRAGKVPEARREFETAIRMKPDYADAHANLSGALGQQGHDEDALREAKVAVGLDEKSVRGNYNLGIALMHLRHYDEAVAPLKRALDLLPGWIDTYQWLASTLYDGNHPADAVAVAEAGLKLEPEQPALLYVFAASLGQLRRWDESIAAWQQVIKNEPTNTEALYAYATTLLQAGRTPQAIEPLEAAIRLKPDYADAQANLGVACWIVGRKQDALAHLEAAVRINPSHAVARDNLAKVRASLAAESGTK